MAKKRGQGEGSIFKLPDGRWRAIVDLGYRNGKRWRKQIEAPTRQAVQEKLKKALRDQQLGFNIAPERQTVQRYLKQWLETVEANVAPATYISYESVVRLHLTPALGRVPLQNLTAPHIEKMKRELLKPKPAKPDSDETEILSPQTVKYCLVVLRLALSAAVKHDLIPRNVALLVDFPKVEHAEIRPYTAAEAQRFLAAAEQNRLGTLFAVALALGLRKGEALAVQWSSIDFDAGTLTVRRTLQRLKMPGEKKGQIVTKEPKRNSRRTNRLRDVAVIEHNRPCKLLELPPNVAQPQVPDGKADARVGRVYLVSVRRVSERTQKHCRCDKC